MKVMADHHLTVSGRISCKPSDNADPIKVTMEPRSRFEIEFIPLVHSRFSHDRIRREVLYVGDKWFPFGEVPGDLSEQFSEFANSKYFVRTSGSTAEDRGLSFSPYFGGSWWREQGNGELQDFVQVRLASGKTGPKSGNGSQSTSSSRSQVVPGRVYLLCLSEKDAAYVLFKVRRFDSPADDLISSTYSNSRFRHASEADPLVRQELDLAVGKARDRLSRINGSYASIAMHVETERIDGESPRDVKYQCFDVNSNKRAPKHKLSEWKPLKRNTPFTGLERISQEQEQWIVIFAGPQHELFWHKTRLTPGEVTDLGHLVLKKSPSTSTVSVRGIVEDVHGAPLSGALVTAGTREDRSDNGGRYQIDQVEPGAFDVNATLDGFFCNPKQWTVQDARDSVVDVDIVMYRPHRVALRYAITSDPNGRFSKEGNEQHSIEFLMSNERVYFKRGLVLRTPKEWQSLPAPWIQFAFAARPSMQFSGDGIQFRGSYCRFSKLEGGLDLFNSIKSVQELQSWRVSRSSDLQEGDVLLVRHQPSTSDSGNKGFALKVFVEKFESVDVTE